ncbi:MAG TPA: YhbY family RNA-binding protein [Gammaproteobacteria bacterium]|nr:YhbY family RNA-binding protein [Gammaproteobacteria bacterium]
MRLTEEQSDYLRILGHSLTPIIDVGAGGLTDSLLKELDRALADHELIKVRVRFGNRERRGRVFEELAPLAQACLVKPDGYVALLFRPSENSKIRLPS